MARQAFFEGLIYDEQDQPVTVNWVGTDAHYVVDDQGFLRHIDAEKIDRQILAMFVEQLQSNKDIAVSQALDFMGKDDLFTKAAVDSSIDEVNVDQILEQGIPLQARNMLSMMGFRIVINYRGEIVDIHHPEMPLDE